MEVKDKRYLEVPFGRDAGKRREPVVGDQQVVVLFLLRDEIIYQFRCRKQVVQEGFSEKFLPVLIPCLYLCRVDNGNDIGNFHQQWAVDIYARTDLRCRIVTRVS